MGIKLIADAGSTKTDWILIDENGGALVQTQTSGVNALLCNNEQLDEVFYQVFEQVVSSFHMPDEIHFYGAGCATKEICDKVADSLGYHFTSARINVYSDLLGAARALFGKDRGIACILGTGSNSCLYDGEKISDNVPSLGYILGDEGSGSALGKRLIGDAFKRQLPEEIRQNFLNEYSLQPADVLEKVYRQPNANRFLASLVPFISKNIWNPYVYSLVYEEFSVFIHRNIAMYPGAHTLPVGVIGSVGVVFEKLLREAASSQGYKVDRIIKSPLEGLCIYHTDSN